MFVLFLESINNMAKAVAFGFSTTNALLMRIKS